MELSASCMTTPPAGNPLRVSLTLPRSRPVPARVPGRPEQAPGRLEPAPGAPQRGKHRTRLSSLDVLRGLTIAAMVLVNVEGDPRYTPAALRHADWDGWTLADLVFPAFLFISGAGMAYAYSRQEGTHGDRATHVALLRRAATLFALGLALNAVLAPLDPIRWMGVLQRIGLATLLGGLVVLHLRPRAQLALGGGVLLGYWVLLSFVPVPGAGSPALDPDASWPGAVDRLVLGAAHMYTPSYDPEGLLSTLPATVTLLAGYWAARWLRPRTGTARASATLVLAGTGVLLLGMAWGLEHPVNKRMWTGSFVLVTAGAAIAVLGAIHHLVDVHGHLRRGWVLRVLGRNAIVVYVVSELAGAAVRARVGGKALRGWVTDSLLAPLTGPSIASVAFSLGLLAVLWVVCWRLWQRRVFVRI